VSDRPSDSASLPAAHRNLSASARNRARYATMALFFIAGMMYASWGVHVPSVRDRFQLNPAMLSLALFAVAGGSIGAMVTNAPWIARVGTRRACLAGGLVMSGAGALILVVPYYWMLLVLLALFGAGMATLDVAMNAEASTVEETLGRPIMSALHGMFSVGGMAGAAVGGAALAHGMAPAVQLRVKLATALAAIALLSACSDDRPWAAYALRDTPGPDDLRILGTFANAGTCRQAALTADSDPDHESLVCTRGCQPPHDGILNDCAETQVIRVPQVAIPLDEQRGAAPPV